MTPRRYPWITAIAAITLGAVGCSSADTTTTSSSADASSSSSQGGGASASTSGAGGAIAVGTSAGQGGATGGAGGSGAASPGLTGFFPGTNLSGAEFASSAIPGKYGTNYTYPTHGEIDYYTGKGLRIFRIPFLWARLQPTLDQDLGAAELGRLKSVVSYAESKGAAVLLDPHNYARYNGKVIGGAEAGAPTALQFGAFWARLAVEFKSDPQVFFGLMNEPHGMKTELWLDDANAAIAAIRATGANNVLFVPGNGYTGAGSWVDSTYYGTPNGKVMLGVVDPLNNYVFEMHMYLDSDSSGTHDTCVSATVGSQRLAKVTDWLAQNHVRAFLGEFAVGENPTCEAALEDLLSFIDKHRDTWAGWTWWGGGPWWAASYMFKLDPVNGVDQPQMATLLNHL